MVLTNGDHNDDFEKIQENKALEIYKQNFNPEGRLPSNMKVELDAFLNRFKSLEAGDPTNDRTKRENKGGRFVNTRKKGKKQKPKWEESGKLTILNTFKKTNAQISEACF